MQLVDGDVVAGADDNAATVAAAEETTTTAPSAGADVVTIASPVSGQVEDLSQVNDEVFSQKMMGDGAAVVPSDGTIYAPADGTLSVAYATKHAYGITADNGAEILIHAGIDTVNLEGQHMESFVEQGQTVKKGDKLGTIDLEAVKAAGYDTTVMVILTNTANYQTVSRDADGEVTHGDDLFTAAK